MIDLINRIYEVIGQIGVDVKNINDKIENGGSGVGGVKKHKLSIDSAYYYDFNNTTIDDWVIYKGKTSDITFSNGNMYLGNNSGNNLVWMKHNTLIPVHEGMHYSTYCRYREVSGSGSFYFGVVGVKSDGVTLVNSSGYNTFSSQYYTHHVASPSSSWTVGGGIIMTNTASVPSGSYRKLHKDCAYITPVLVCNYPSNNGTCEIDWMKIHIV